MTRLAVESERMSEAYFRADAQDELDIVQCARWGLGLIRMLSTLPISTPSRLTGAPTVTLLDFRQIGEQAIFRAERAGSGDVEDADRQMASPTSTKTPTRSSVQVSCLRCAMTLFLPRSPRNPFCRISVPPRMLFGRCQEIA